MNADVSRSIARFTASLNLGQEASRQLAAEYADVEDADDLPEWIREVDDNSEVTP